MTFGENLTFETGLLAVAALLSAIFIGIRLARYAKERARRPHEKVHPSTAAVQERARLPEILGELVLEIDELSRRLTKQADEEAAKLQAAVRAADERIARLASLLAAARKTAAAPPSRFHAARQEPTGDRAQRVCELADAGEAALNIAETLDMPLAEVELLLSLRSMSRAPTTSVTA
jgi:hypothetical protein